jgi:hypothetical protein
MNYGGSGVIRLQRGNPLHVNGQAVFGRGKYFCIEHGYFSGTGHSAC